METQKIVVAAVIQQESRVLIAKLAEDKRIAPGKWHLPGGHVEFGESPKDAIVREIQEELGFLVEVESLVGVFDYRESDVHTVGVCFLARPAGAIPDQPHTFDHSDVKWITSEQVEEFFPVNDHNRRNLLAAFDGKERL